MGPGGKALLGGGSIALLFVDTTYYLGPGRLATPRRSTAVMQAMRCWCPRRQLCGSLQCVGVSCMAKEACYPRL